MIDWEARQALCDAIDDVFSERASTLSSGEAMEDIPIHSGDETVTEVYHILWRFYDEDSDKFVIRHRQGWGLVQRLKLVLMSGSVMEVRRRRIWSLRQAIALIGFVICAVLFCRIGFVPEFLLVTASAGIVYFLLDHMRPTHTDRDTEITRTYYIWPFGSVWEIADAVAAAPDFRKQPYRPAADSRRPVNWYWPPNLFGMLIDGPILLLAHCLPDCDVHTRLIVGTKAN
ncbi:hypothetical protein [Stratiformator vulcanicus]|uniref:Uncharacterized protein n=1 Tax=Stratiformator vulcanicus TaxID=2527980 RepID=A0A517QX69_9PLAN|nr:hypothetical protein [Stratiformator vulcanicus]QDT36256.1 hypothetical protein Pan189_06110 [Stratiformator vulcanicus]